MTPTQVIALARRQYNAVSDSFFSDEELLSHMYAGSMELAREAFAIERVYTTTSVASQQQYAFPTNVLAIKRITYNGQKLKPITFREDDVLTLSQDNTTETGTPLYYFIWNETLYLRPIPSTSSLTIKVFGYAEPQEISITSTIEVPSRFHTNLADYLTFRMSLKDSNTNPSIAAAYKGLWLEHKAKAVKEFMKLKRGDSFHVVKDTDQLVQTVLGES